MNNPHLSKRKKNALLFFSYGMMTLAVIAISIICIFLILGYQFNSKSGTIEQGGLMQFRSFPAGAAIDLDETRLGFRTPGKLNVSAGEHTVSMRLNGYKEWSKRTTVNAGELKWLNYARLIPDSITTTPVRAFPALSDALPSPDRRWYALLTEAANPAVTLYDLRNPQEPVAAQIAIPEAAFTQSADSPHVFSLEEWDFGARYLFVKHQVGQTVEFIRIDRTGESEPVNITKEFNLPFSDIHFSGTSGNIYYALNGTDIRLIDLGARSVSRPLVSNVSHFELYKADIIAYTATHSDKQVVGVYIDDKDTVVRSYPLDTPIKIDISSYFDHEYLAVSNGKQVQIIKDPSENTDSAGRVFAEFSATYDVASVQFASSGRFLVAANGIDITTYDLETDDLFISRFEGTPRDSAKPLQWLDDYYLVSDSTGSLVISEFDGANRHSIAKVEPGFAVTLSDDGEYLFSIGKTNEGFVLQSSRMINE